MDYFAQVTLLAAGAVLIVQQIIKLNFIPIAIANKYPVPTNIVLSIIAAFVAVWRTDVQPDSVGAWIVFVGTIAVVAAISYNQLLGRWKELKEAEGTGQK